MLRLELHHCRCISTRAGRRTDATPTAGAATLNPAQCATSADPQHQPGERRPLTETYERRAGARLDSLAAGERAYSLSIGGCDGKNPRMRQG